MTTEEGGEIYYRGGAEDEILLDPRTLNLDELPLVLAMAGWAVMIGFPEDEGGDVSLVLTDMGGSGGMTEPEMALALRMIDDKTGELLPGYKIGEEFGRLEISYRGVADLRFAEFVKAVHGLSPWEI